MGNNSSNKQVNRKNNMDNTKSYSNQEKRNATASKQGAIPPQVLPKKPGSILQSSRASAAPSASGAGKKSKSSSMEQYDNMPGEASGNSYDVNPDSGSKKKRPASLFEHSGRFDIPKGGQNKGIFGDDALVGKSDEIAGLHMGNNIQSPSMKEYENMPGEASGNSYNLVGAANNSAKKKTFALFNKIRRRKKRKEGAKLVDTLHSPAKLLPSTLKEDILNSPGNVGEFVLDEFSDDEGDGYESLDKYSRDKSTRDSSSLSGQTSQSFPASAAPSASTSEQALIANNEPVYATVAPPGKRNAAASRQDAESLVPPLPLRPPSLFSQGQGASNSSVQVNSAATTTPGKPPAQKRPAPPPPSHAPKPSTASNSGQGASGSLFQVNSAATTTPGKPPAQKRPAPPPPSHAPKPSTASNSAQVPQNSAKTSTTPRRRPAPPTPHGLPFPSASTSGQGASGSSVQGNSVAATSSVPSQGQGAPSASNSAQVPQNSAKTSTTPGKPPVPSQRKSTAQKPPVPPSASGLPFPSASTSGQVASGSSVQGNSVAATSSVPSQGQGAPSASNSAQVPQNSAKTSTTPGKPPVPSQRKSTAQKPPVPPSASGLPFPSASTSGQVASGSSVQGNSVAATSSVPSQGQGAPSASNSAQVPQNSAKTSTTPGKPPVPSQRKSTAPPPPSPAPKPSTASNSGQGASGSSVQGNSVAATSSVPSQGQGAPSASNSAQVPQNSAKTSTTPGKPPAQKRPVPPPPSPAPKPSTASNSAQVPQNSAKTSTTLGRRTAQKRPVPPPPSPAPKPSTASNSAQVPQNSAKTSTTLGRRTAPPPPPPAPKISSASTSGQGSQSSTAQKPSTASTSGQVASSVSSQGQGAQSSTAPKPSPVPSQGQGAQSSTAFNRLLANRRRVLGFDGGLDLDSDDDWDSDSDEILIPATSSDLSPGQTMQNLGMNFFGFKKPSPAPKPSPVPSQGQGVSSSRIKEMSAASSGLSLTESIRRIGGDISGTPKISSDSDSGQGASNSSVQVNSAAATSSVSNSAQVPQNSAKTSTTLGRRTAPPPPPPAPKPSPVPSQGQGVSSSRIKEMSAASSGLSLTESIRRIGGDISGTPKISSDSDSGQGASNSSVQVNSAAATSSVSNSAQVPQNSAKTSTTLGRRTAPPPPPPAPKISSVSSPGQVASGSLFQVNSAAATSSVSNSAQVPQNSAKTSTTLGRRTAPPPPPPAPKISSDSDSGQGASNSSVQVNSAAATSPVPSQGQGAQISQDMSETKTALVIGDVHNILFESIREVYAQFNNIVPLLFPLEDSLISKIKNDIDGRMSKTRDELKNFIHQEFQTKEETSSQEIIKLDKALISQVQEETKIAQDWLVSVLESTSEVAGLVYDMSGDSQRNQDLIKSEINEKLALHREMCDDILSIYDGMHSEMHELCKPLSDQEIAYRLNQMQKKVEDLKYNLNEKILSNPNLNLSEALKIRLQKTISLSCDWLNDTIGYIGSVAKRINSPIARDPQSNVLDSGQNASLMTSEPKISRSYDRSTDDGDLFLGADFLNDGIDSIDNLDLPPYPSTDSFSLPAGSAFPGDTNDMAIDEEDSNMLDFKLPPPPTQEYLDDFDNFHETPVKQPVASDPQSNVLDGGQNASLMTSDPKIFRSYDRSTDDGDLFLGADFLNDGTDVMNFDSFSLPAGSAFSGDANDMAVDEEDSNMLDFKPLPPPTQEYVGNIHNFLDDRSFTSIKQPVTSNTSVRYEERPPKSSTFRQSSKGPSLSPVQEERGGDQLSTNDHDRSFTSIKQPVTSNTSVRYEERPPRQYSVHPDDVQPDDVQSGNVQSGNVQSNMVDLFPVSLSVMSASLNPSIFQSVRDINSSMGGAEVNILPALSKVLFAMVARDIDLIHKNGRAVEQYLVEAFRDERTLELSDIENMYGMSGKGDHPIDMYTMQKIVVAATLSNVLLATSRENSKLAPSSIKGLESICSKELRRLQDTAIEMATSQINERPSSQINDAFVNSSRHYLDNGLLGVGDSSEAKGFAQGESLKIYKLILYPNHHGDFIKNYFGIGADLEFGTSSETALSAFYNDVNIARAAMVNRGAHRDITKTANLIDKTILESCEILGAYQGVLSNPSLSGGDDSYESTLFNKRIGEVKSSIYKLRAYNEVLKNIEGADALSDKHKDLQDHIKDELDNIESNMSLLRDNIALKLEKPMRLNVALYFAVAAITFVAAVISAIAAIAKAHSMNSASVEENSQLSSEQPENAHNIDSSGHYVDALQNAIASNKMDIPEFHPVSGQHGLHILRPDGTLVDINQATAQDILRAKADPEHLLFGATKNDNWASLQSDPRSSAALNYWNYDVNDAITEYKRHLAEVIDKIQTPDGVTDISGEELVGKISSGELTVEKLNDLKKDIDHFGKEVESISDDLEKEKKSLGEVQGDIKSSLESYDNIKDELKEEIGVEIPDRTEHKISIEINDLFPKDQTDLALLSTTAAVTGIAAAGAAAVSYRNMKEKVFENRVSENKVPYSIYRKDRGFAPAKHDRRKRRISHADRLGGSSRNASFSR